MKYKFKYNKITDIKGKILSDKDVKKLLDRYCLLQNRIDAALMILTLYDCGKYDTKKDLIETIYKARFILDTVRTHYSISDAFTKEYKKHCNQLSKDIDEILKQDHNSYVHCKECGAAISKNKNNSICFSKTVKR